MTTTIPAQYRIRAYAAMRLVPLDCGCQDPDSRSHLRHDDLDDDRPENPCTRRCQTFTLSAIAHYARVHGRCPCLVEADA